MPGCKATAGLPNPSILSSGYAIQAAMVMRQIHISNTEISQLYRRIVFNVMARNQDDHVKNISFLMDRTGRWSLAPAYDVTYAYNPDGMWTGSHQMSINGKRDAVTYQDLLLSARSMGVKKAEAEQIITAVKESLSGWYGFAEAAKLRESEAQAVSDTWVAL